METRQLILKIFAVLIFAALLGRLAYLQIFQGERYYRLAEDNRLRVQQIDPVRGLIYDRMGRLLVDNQPGYSVVGAPMAVLQHPQTLEELESILGEERSEA